jgi:glc operon protein GlcG
MRFAATIVAVTVAALPLAYAQTPPTTPAPVPEAMPFDIPYGTPIGMDEAQKAIMGAMAEAKKHSWKMSISVVDPNGYLIAHATMDGTQYGSILISQAKARTAAMFRRPSGAFQTAINTGGFPSNLSLLGMNGAVASEGGFPIVIDGKLVGAIGASGGIFTQDAVVAKAGLEAVGGK